MKSIRSFFWVLLLAALALGLLPAFAHAQAFAQGKFTLSHDTHWGKAVLSPGEYEFSLLSATFPGLVMVRKAESSSTIFVLPASLSETNTLDSTQLILQSRGDQMFVASLYLKDLGLVLNYNLPEMKPELTAARSRRPLEQPATTASVK